MANAVSKLESLTRIAIDSANGYENAADAAKSPELKRILADAGTKRRRLVDQLNTELVRIGGERQTSGTASGAAHRAFTQLSDMFGSGDEKATDRVEEGEDYIEEKFRDALDDNDFTPETREMLRRAHAELKEGERLADRLEKQYD